MAVSSDERKQSWSNSTKDLYQEEHPYLSGNFAPMQQTLPLTPCPYTGEIPEELVEGEYVRNGCNPVSNDDLGRDAHWFDGDGMLSGVWFAKDESTGDVTPTFVNQFVLTDLYLSTISSERLQVPILPSITTLVNPLVSVFWVILRILRTVMLVILSHLPGSKHAIKKISVANTNIIYHDGRAMATCESGPPMRIQLPGLDTVGWYNGASAEGEPAPKIAADNDQLATLGGKSAGLIKFMREWTTAHPKIDPVTKEMMMFHSSFAPPYVQYSIIPQTANPDPEKELSFSLPRKKLLNAAVPGVSSAKMMHDFGVSMTHTVIMDLPLSLDPMNQLYGLPPVSFNSDKPSRFGVFPRRRPDEVQWFETDASCIFHTANTWDHINSDGKPTSVSMLACRLTSGTLIFATGNLRPPGPVAKKTESNRKRRMPFLSKYNQDTEPTVHDKSPLLESSLEEHESVIRGSENGQQADLDELLRDDQCRLYYYEFDLEHHDLKHQWALSAIPFEFPSVHPRLEMQEARYVYGCSTTTTSFGSALGKATKIDVLVKVDTTKLIERGCTNPPCSVTGVVDERTMSDVLASPRSADDPIQVFRMPHGWYAQEPRFVPATSDASEDDGYLIFYAFDETQLLPSGEVPSDTSQSRATSELWIVNARHMSEVVARVQLPQRVPYGLHGTWFSAEQIGQQRPVEMIRSTVRALEDKDEGWWMSIRDHIERLLG